MKNLLKALMVVAILAGNSMSHAAILTYNFSGSLTSSLGSLSSGDPFSGSFSLDTAVPANGGSTTSFSVFNNLTQVSLTIGSFSALVGPGAGLPEIQQDDVPGADRYGLIARNAVGSSQIGGLDVTTIGFRLDDTTGTAISDALQLVTDLNLANFTSNTFLLFFEEIGTQNFEVVTGVLNQLGQPSTVPEPVSLALLALGLAGIGLSRRKKA